MSIVAVGEVRDVNLSIVYTMPLKAGSVLCLNCPVFATISSVNEPIAFFAKRPTGGGFRIGAGHQAEIEFPWLSDFWRIRGFVGSVGVPLAVALWQGGSSTRTFTS